MCSSDLMHVYTHTCAHTYMYTHTFSLLFSLTWALGQASRTPVCTLLFFLYKFIYFIYFWLHWVFVAVRRLSLVAVSRGYSSLRCAGFSLRWLLLLRSTGSRRAGFSSCSTRAQ